jgi:glyoxylase-like metal-dependent hydrolase (beta-lactamase superfamily II)
LNLLFVSDFCYHGVHAWAGQGVEKEHIRNWIQVLGDLKAEYFGTGATVYPGHGEPGGVELFDTMRTYLEDFLSAIQSGRTNREILERMRKIYPTHAEVDFLLHHSVLYHGPDSKSAAVVEQA